MAPPPEAPPLHIALIGAGIAGLTLAASLAARDIPFTLFESSAQVGAGGVGVAFNPATERALRVCSEDVFAAYESVVSRPNAGGRSGVFFDLVDGFFPDPAPNGSTAQAEDGGKGEQHTKAERTGRFFSLRNELGMAAVHRQSFCEALLALIPPASIKLGKRLAEIEQPLEGKVVLCFEDGTKFEADAVIGTDGIKSRVKRHLLGTHPSASAAYTGVTNARAIIPLDAARAALGDEDALSPTSWLGPDAHIVTVSFGALFSFSAFFKDPAPANMTADARLSAQVPRAAVAAPYAHWNPRVQRILALLPETLPTWRIADTAAAHPPTYAAGRVCIAGDAAHATTPYLGSGAGFCVEDAAVLATLLAEVKGRVEQGSARARALTAAFGAFDATRRPRAEWMVKNSREAGALHQWRGEGVEGHWRGIEEGMRWRFAEIWKFDTLGMVAEAREEFARRVEMETETGDS